jgi:hypothetical protein
MWLSQGLEAPDLSEFNAIKIFNSYLTEITIHLYYKHQLINAVMMES